MRLISQNTFALILSAAFLVPTVMFSAPVKADANVELRFWGTPDDYQTWCAENYPSCVTWGELPGTWRARYRTWWEGRHHGERWGHERMERHERHEHEHEHHDED